MIHQVTLEDDFQLLAFLLNDAFITIANEFGLTKENSATNNAFISAEALKSQLTEYRKFFYIKDDGVPVGFVAIEQSEKDGTVFYIEKVGVHPDFRHKGIGRKLMDFAYAEIEKMGGKKISIGLIDKNHRLKEWYRQQGFVEVGVKSYFHLPFDVCFMEKYLYE